MAESSSDDEIILLQAARLVLERRKRRERRWWVRPWVDRRRVHGAYHALLHELRDEDIDSYKNFLRMDPLNFDHLVGAVTPLIKKKGTNMRESISPAERLAVTLRFLASGDSYQSMQYLYRIGRSTLGTIIPETCKAIVSVLKEKYLRVPQTTEEWEAVACAFDETWNFPHCIGAIDGKHIAIKAPPNGGSMFYNYKDFHSIVLMAVVDAQYRFIWYDLGANGRNNDAGVFSCSTFASALENGSLNIPTPSTIRTGGVPVPFVLVGDEAFPLKANIMKPYPKKGLDCSRRIFNYRLSRARRVSENAFGILINRFAVLAKVMNIEPNVATTVTEACLALHNFLRTENDVRYAQEVRRSTGDWFRDNDRQFISGNHSTSHAREVREELLLFFNGEGQVPWQWENI